MDIDNLNTFLKVVETRSFSRSAEELKITQPAVSKRIAALESQFDVRLFDRLGRTIHLTEAGRMLLPAAKQIQSEVLRIEDVISNDGNEIHGKLSIGSTAYIATQQLSRILREFRETHTEVGLNLQLGNPESIIESVSDNSLELAVCPLNTRALNSLSPNLCCTELWEDKLEIVVSKASPLALSQHVSLQKLVETPAILPSPKTLARETIYSQFAANSVEPVAAAIADDFQTMRALACMGLGWTCLPRQAIDDSLRMITIDELNLSHTVVLVRRRGYSLTKAAEKFIGLLPVDATSHDMTGIDADVESLEAG